MGQSFNQGLYYFSYVIQKKEYMKRCVNKARPMLHCNGKCQLMKKIEEQEKKEQGQLPMMKYASKVEVLSSRSSLALNFDVSFTLLKLFLFTADSGSPIDQPASIFHPPPAHC